MPARSVSHDRPAVGPLGMYLHLDDCGLRCCPALGPVVSREEPSLRLARSLILFDCFLEEAFAQLPEPRVHTDAESIGEPQFSTNNIHARHAKAAVAAHVNMHIRPGGAEPCHKI